ncbi:MAG: mechanosensitive ion channel family protein [Candidatus Aminicenantales bacterium]
MEILEKVFYGNTLQAWLIALGVTGLGFIALSVLKKVIGRKAAALAQRTATEVDDFAAELIQLTRSFSLLVLSLYLGSQFLYLPDPAKRILSKITILAILLQSVIWANGLFKCWRERIREKKKDEDPASLATYNALGFLVRLAVWSVVLLLALDNLGINITALVAGLGIGGIAIALAVQNILGDLFASMSILLDKPFIIGDFIIVDDLRGTVEHIGLKTTRIRSLSGEQLVFANSDLLKSRIRNYKRMEERRAVFDVGVVYQTPPEKLAAIPGMIAEIVNAQELARFDRSHFKSFGNFSLDFETVYYVRSPDYIAYMDIQQAINLAIFRRFQEEGIEFAYPTQTVFVDRISNPAGNQG